MLEVEKVANVAFWARMGQSDAGKIEWVGSDPWAGTCAHWPHTAPGSFSPRRWASRNADVGSALWSEDAWLPAVCLLFACCLPAAITQI